MVSFEIEFLLKLNNVNFSIILISALKRKVSEYEQKTVILKHKSDCYEQLMTKKLKLDEIPNSPEVTDTHSEHSPSPLLMNGASRSASPLDSTETSVSQDPENSSEMPAEMS